MTCQSLHQLYTLCCLYAESYAGLEGRPVSCINERVQHEGGHSSLTQMHGLQEMIDEADRDGDGEVNEEEFIRIMKKTSLF